MVETYKQGWNAPVWRESVHGVARAVSGTRMVFYTVGIHTS